MGGEPALDCRLPCCPKTLTIADGWGHVVGEDLCDCHLVGALGDRT